MTKQIMWLPENNGKTRLLGRKEEIRNAENDMRGKKNMKITRKKRGASLVELIFGASLTILVVIGGFSIFTATLTSWHRGLEQIAVEIEVQRVLKHIRNHLQEAALIRTLNSGPQITFYLPRRNADGDYLYPKQPDKSVALQYTVRSDGTLVFSRGNYTRVLSRNVVLQFNDNGTLRPYVPFTLTNPPRHVIVQIACRREIRRGEWAWARARETIYPRNINY